MIDSPFVVFCIAVLVQWGAAYAGDFFRKRIRPIEAKEREDLDTVLTATLTLFALIVGFTFSMAVTRYDLRKNYEEAEANAIGTEYLRTDLLPAEDGAKVRALLRTYINQRILFYQGKEQRIDAAGVKELGQFKCVAGLGRDFVDLGLADRDVNTLTNFHALA